MDYKKLKEKIISSHGEIQIFFEQEGKTVKFSEGGFYQAVRNDSLKICKLENISKALGLPMSYWWEDNESLKINDYKQDYGIKLIKSLEKNIEIYEKEIDYYKKELQQLKAINHKITLENDDLKVKLGFSKASGSE